MKIINKRKLIKKKKNDNNLKIKSILNNKHFGKDYTSMWVPARKRLFILTYAYDDYITILENTVHDISLLILLIVITCIIGVTGDLYIIIATIIDSIFRKQIINWFIITRSLFWCIITIGKIGILVLSVSNAAEEVS